MLRLVTLLATFACASTALADVVLTGEGGPTYVFFTKYGPFWRARERGVVGIRACAPDVAARLPRPAKFPIGGDLGSKAANDVFWDKYDRWMEKVEPGCAAKPAQYFDAASFRGLVKEAAGDGESALQAEVRGWNTVAPTFRGEGDPMTVLMGIVGDRYQLMDLSGTDLPKLRTAFEAIATLTVPSLAAPADAGGTEGQNAPLPAELTQDPSPQPVGKATGVARSGKLHVSWGGAPADVEIGGAQGLRVVKLKDGVALAPRDGGLVAIDRDQDGVLQQAATAGLPVDTYDLTRAEWAEKNRDAWTLDAFRKVYAALGDQSRVFVFQQKEAEVYVLTAPGQELEHVVTSAHYPLEEALVARVGTKRVFRGPRAAAELLRIHEEKH